MMGFPEMTDDAPIGDAVVMFIHGILGSPSQFNALVDGLGGRYAVDNLPLPGHGGTIRDFAASSLHDWKDDVRARIRRLEASYRSIILVGHSMGCLLAIGAALERPEKIRGLLLLSPPLVIRVRSLSVVRTMTRALSRDKGGISDDSLPKKHRLNLLACARALPRFLELFAESRKTRMLVKRLKLPVTAVHADRDEAVSVQSLRWFEGLENVRLMTAMDSDHFHYSDEAKNSLIAELCRLAEQPVDKSVRSGRTSPLANAQQS